MESSEINGFKIDEFNQYKLDSAAERGICPICSEHRKPENKKAKCASYDWDRGIGTCHHCSESFQLHTYKRKSSSEKTYVRPNPLEIKSDSSIDSRVVDWFKGRAISKETLLELKVDTGVEWMPQTKKSENVIKFNF